MRKFVVALAALFMFVTVQQAQAAPPASIFGGEINCTTQAQPDGRTLCSGPGGDTNAAPGVNQAVANTVPSYDGVPIDINFALPNAAEFGDGPYPLAMYFHGFGGGKEGFDGDLKRFTDLGFAAFSMTERGFKFSCGKVNAITTLNNDTPGVCNKGFIHLMDTRFEVRDAQYFAGLLADEDLILPKKIGTVGASYGGAKSMSLAALKNRIMNPDGTLSPWKSPEGKDMEIAVAAPIVPPTDFAYALTPNGRTYDYTRDNPYLGPNGDAPFGVMKSAITNGLATAGDSFSGEHGTDLDALWDINGWKVMMNAGEPFDVDVANTMREEMTAHHSSYYIDHSIEPAPMIIAQGLTDDLFPLSEAIRFYNRTKSQYPDSTVGLLFADIGHPRAPLEEPNEQGRPADMELGYSTVETWFDYYLNGNGSKPDAGVTSMSMVCPYSQPSGGPFKSDTWANFAPGEMRLSDPTTRVIESEGGDQAIAAGFLTLIPACTQQPETEEPGIAQYDFPVSSGAGYTLGGSTTVIADISVANGGSSQVAARLLEISAGGNQRLIARGVYRPEASGTQVMQLNANVYHFAPGTKLRIQLLPRDGNVGGGLMFSSFRPSNDQQDVTISNVEIRVPVREEPGALNGLVKAPAKKVLPPGYELATEFSSIGSQSIDEYVAERDAKPGKLKVKSATVKGKQLTARVSCPAAASNCAKARLSFKGAAGKGRGLVLATKTGVTAKPGKTATVRINLTLKARKLFRDSKRKTRRNGKVKVRKVKGLKSLKATVLINGKPAGKVTVKRTGKVK